MTKSINGQKMLRDDLFDEKQAKLISELEPEIKGFIEGVYAGLIIANKKLIEAGCKPRLELPPVEELIQQAYRNRYDNDMRKAQKDIFKK